MATYPSARKIFGKYQTTNLKDVRTETLITNNVIADSISSNRVSSQNVSLNGDDVATKTDLNELKDSIFDGVSNSYDTLKEIETYINDNTNAVSSILTTLNTRATTSALINTNVEVTNLTSRVTAVEGENTTQASFINQLWESKEDKSSMSSYYKKAETDQLLVSPTNRITTLESDNTSNKVRLTTLETNIQDKASVSYVDDEISTAITSLINNSPAALDTLNELSLALGNDPNFATSVTNSISLKANQSSLDALQTNITNNYLTTTSASSLYQTIANMTNYLTSSVAASTYQTISGMSTYFGLSSNNTITGSNTFNNVQTIERMCEQVTQAGSGTNLSLNYSTIKSIIVYAPSGNFTLSLTNLPTTNSNCVYTLTFIYSTKFFCNAININSTLYQMTAIGGLTNITVSSNATRVYQQIQIIFTNSSTPTVSTSVLSLW
jgi:hypothetical protein